MIELAFVHVMLRTAGSQQLIRLSGHCGCLTWMTSWCSADACSPQNDAQHMRTAPVHGPAVLWLAASHQTGTPCHVVLSSRQHPRVPASSKRRQPGTQPPSMRRRWLLGLLVLQSTSSLVLDQYQQLLREHLVVTLFLTMLVGAGGNAGTLLVTQSPTFTQPEPLISPSWSLEAHFFWTIAFQGCKSQTMRSQGAGSCSCSYLDVWDGGGPGCYAAVIVLVHLAAACVQDSMHGTGRACVQPGCLPCSRHCLHGRHAAHPRS